MTVPAAEKSSRCDSPENLEKVHSETSEINRIPKFVRNRRNLRNRRKKRWPKGRPPTASGDARAGRRQLLLYYLFAIIYLHSPFRTVSYGFPGFPGALLGFPGSPGVRSQKAQRVSEVSRRSLGGP